MEKTTPAEPVKSVEPEKQDSFASRDFKRACIEAVAYMGTIAAALMAMWSSLRDGCYEHVKKTTGLLDEARKNRIDGLKAAAAKKENGIFNKLQYNEEKKRVIGIYKGGIQKAYNTLEIHNLWDMFRELPKAQRVTIIGLGITAISVGIGAISSISHRLQIATQLDEMRREKLVKKEPEATHVSMVTAPVPPTLMHR